MEEDEETWEDLDFEDEDEFDDMYDDYETHMKWETRWSNFV